MLQSNVHLQGLGFYGFMCVDVVDFNLRFLAVEGLVQAFLAPIFALLSTAYTAVGSPIHIEIPYDIHR